MANLKVMCQFVRVVEGVDLRSTAGNCAWTRTPQLTGAPSLHSADMHGSPHPAAPVPPDRQCIAHLTKDPRRVCRRWALPMCHMSPGCAGCCRSLDTLGFERRAFRMRSGCDTTTPCAQQNIRLHRSSKYNSWWGPRANPWWVEACGGPGRCPAAHCCRSLDTLGFEPRAFGP